MTKAEEIFEKHWKLTTGKELDETTKHHMQYCIDAIDEALDLPIVSDCPDLTNIWNIASFKADKEEITVRRMNEIWGALRVLKRQGLCKLADSSYD